MNRIALHGKGWTAWTVYFILQYTVHALWEVINKQRTIDDEKQHKLFALIIRRKIYFVMQKMATLKRQKP